MQTKWAGKDLHYYECIESTNTELVSLIKEGAPHGALVMADMQTAGRGRRGRSWESPKGCNIYFSLLLRPSFAPENASMLTLVMACAVAKGIEQALQESMSVTAVSPKLPQTQIKWPNDILMNHKKICGILTELRLDAIQKAGYQVIVGVGINVKAQAFPPELSDKAGSIEQESGICLSRKVLTEKILSAFEGYYEQFSERGDLSLLMEEYNAMLVNLGREVKVLDPKGEFCGVAKGINKNGELLVELPSGKIEQVYAGEVSVRGICGYV